MKQIVKNWIFALVIVGLIAGGCSAPYARMGNDFARNDQPQTAYFGLPATEGSDELWVIERNSNVANLSNAALQPPEASGGLKAIVQKRQREMPLRHMDVNAHVDGYLATVDVKQEFENPYQQKIEAVYEFALPAQAAVDDFVMTIGKRRIRGIIRERKNAEMIYIQAKELGYLASLLSADESNTFRQTIANIEPGNNIDVNIHYFQTLHFQDGWYEFLFPAMSNSKGSSNQWNVPVSLHMDVNAGAPIADIECPHHLVVKKSISPEHSTVQLSPADGIPYLDFKLRYRLASDAQASDLMTYQDDRGGYFTFLLHPPTNSPLTNVKIDWGAMQASEIFPLDYSTLPAGRAVLLAGRFTGHGPTAIVVTGTENNRPVSFSIPVDLSKASTEKSIPKIWASMKIAKIKREALWTNNFEFIHQITQVALDYGLSSPFTAFLAVDASEPAEKGERFSAPGVP